MKNLPPFLLSFILLLSLLSSCSAPSEDQKTEKNEDAVDRRVEQLLATMTLTDKVGEMTQLAIDMLMVGEPYNVTEPQQLDTAKLRKVLLDLRVGSILNVAAHRYPQQQWHDIMATIQDIAMNQKPTGIPVLYGIDAIHGTNYTAEATLFPQQIAQAASRNLELAKDIGRITAYETRASAIPWTFSPMLDIGRDPRWPRLWEGFGEDVYLTSRMGEAIIEGYQGDDLSDPFRVAACMKHFIGYSTPRTGKDRVPAYIPRRQLLEYHVPSFQAGVDAGAATVMINSAEMNGIPVHANPKILIDLLRKEMGFEGLAVTDWADITYFADRHKISHDYKEAIKTSINAGIDMSMVPVDLNFPVLLRELVEEGEVPMSRIDEAVRRILKLKFQLGLFEKPFSPISDFPDFGSEKHRLKSLEAAQECLTLLKNKKDLLPLSKSSRVLVTGPTANTLSSLNGGWSNTWQGRDPQYDTKGKLTVLQAIQAEIGAERVTYVPGTTIEVDNNTHIDQAVNVAEAAAAARRADVAIVCLGELAYTENPGNLVDLSLPLPQQELVEAIAATGTPVVLVLLEGRPRVISRIEPQAAGILLGYLPGNEGGPAIADVLFGDVNPSGKLPYTYPRHVNDLVLYDHKYTELLHVNFAMDAFNPQYEFGHGLSYTDFAYSDLAISEPSMSVDGSIDISVKVKNTGSRAGKEVVELFISDLVASITPSVKRLRGFEKIALEAGEEKTVSFNIPARDLAFVGIDLEWIVEPGAFVARIGGLEGKFTVSSME